MEKTTLLRKLEVLVDEAARTHLFGTIEIDFRAGKPVLLRRSAVDKLEEDGKGARTIMATDKPLRCPLDVVKDLPPEWFGLPRKVCLLRKVVLVAIAASADPDGTVPTEFSPGEATLAKRAACDQRSVRRVVKLAARKFSDRHRAARGPHESLLHHTGTDSRPGG